MRELVDQELRETYLEGETLYEGAILTLQKWKVSLPDGREANREIVLHKGAAAIVPVDAHGEVTLVRQHRVALDQFLWEIPAGKLDFTGEDPLSCARRELEEETGLRAKNWQLLNKVITTPGFCTEQISIYLATGLSQHEVHRDQDEFLQLCKMPLHEAVAKVMSGELTDAKTCLGLLLAQQSLAALKPRPRYGDGLPPYRRTARGPVADGRG